MARPAQGRPGRDIESWLARKIRLRNLRSLPPYLANGGGIVHLPEAFARVLLTSLQSPHVDPRSAERIKDDARAFRSWVEGSQLDLIPVHRPEAEPSRPGSP